MLSGLEKPFCYTLFLMRAELIKTLNKYAEIPID
jgi:hypothetical protein